MIRISTVFPWLKTRFPWLYFFLFFFSPAGVFVSGLPVLRRLLVYLYMNADVF